MHYQTILFINNAFLVRGMISFLRQLVPENNFMVYDKISYKIDVDHPIFIIDKNVLSDKPEVTFDQLRKKFKHCKIILISQNNPHDKLLPYIDECLLLTDPEEVVEDKIRSSYSNNSGNLSTNDQTSLISDREREVLRLVALGLTNREISDELCISAHTVITHRKNITAKLGIKTIAGLAVYAVLNNIISADELNKNTPNE